MSFGALEAQALVVPVGGWTVHVDDGTVFDATVAAGTYSPTTLLAAFVAALEAGSAQSYSGSIANGEGGTGVVSVVIAGSATFSVTWTSSDLRDALGYTGALGAAKTQTSTYCIKGLWLPDCPMSGSYGAADPGHTVGGLVQTRSPLGVIKSISHPTYVELPSVTWTHVSAARTRQAAESGAPRSWERFCREVIYGNASGVSYFTPGGVVRLIWNADSPGTYTDYYPIAPKTTATPRADAAWSGLYSVSFAGTKL